MEDREASTRTNSLAGFIAIARSQTQKPAERRMIGFSTTVASVLFLIGLLHTPFKYLSLSLSLLIFLGLSLSSYLHAQSEPEMDRGHLLRFLNYRRAKEGLHTVLDPKMLDELEFHARRWEEIEYALQTEGWRSREPLRSDIQQGADQAMVELVALASAEGPVQGVSSWHESWDLNVDKLAKLRASLADADTFLSAYHRPSELSASAPLPQDPIPGHQ